MTFFEEKASEECDGLQKLRGMKQCLISLARKATLTQEVSGWYENTMRKRLHAHSAYRTSHSLPFGIAQFEPVKQL